MGVVLLVLFILSDFYCFLTSLPWVSLSAEGLAWMETFNSQSLMSEIHLANQEFLYHKYHGQSKDTEIISQINKGYLVQSCNQGLGLKNMIHRNTKFADYFWLFLKHPHIF